jgi:hypothetical protein
MLALPPPSGSNLIEAQDSPDNSMFSFAIGVNPSEEIQPSAESAELPNDVRLKLQEILPLLDQDVSQLVKDAEPIRAILKSLEGRLPESIEDALVHVAFIESHRR